MNEANLRMEFEQFKMSILAADSIKCHSQKREIDSLRQITAGAPVVANGDTLFYVYAKKGGYTPQQRAEMTGEAIEKIGKQFNLDPDQVTVEYADIMTDIMYGKEVLLSLTDTDAMWEGVSREELVNQRRENIVTQLHAMKAEFGMWRQIKRVAYFLLVIVAQFVFFRLTKWAFSKVDKRIIRLKHTKLKPITLQTYELLDTDKQVTLLLFLSRMLRYGVMILQLLISVPIVFSIFPHTEGLAWLLLGYILDPIKAIFMGVINYIPNLITIVIIWYAIHALVRLTHYIAKEIECGNLKFQGFFPDWAMPTYHIIRILLYAFMIAMIYNYLPGSNSGVFQGISVFVGLIISLGSSTMIANLMAGLVITFMRPFKIGDRIKLNDTTGDIIEKTPLVTRVKTPKNEIVTIPNSFVMSSLTTNYTSSAQQYGLIIHSDVTFGYEVPWE